MTLADLIMTLDVVSQEGDLNVEVVNVTEDSRQVKPGTFFVAVKGTQVDGHEFLDQACAQGATGLLVEAPFSKAKLAAFEGRLPAIVEVTDTRTALGSVASRFWSEPSCALTMIGVTGTNGKTTVTHVAKGLLEASARKVGLLGTVGYFIGAEHFSASHTTPGAVALQSLLSQMVKGGADTAVLEVSSHALALDRVAGCEFDIVVFTNLTQDHLDFHRDMHDYFQAKLRLFQEYVLPKTKSSPKRAIVNIDDEWGQRILQQCAVPVWSYSIRHSADLSATDLSLSIDGTTFTAVTPIGSLPIHSSLVGEHNVYNLLAAIGIGVECGMSLEMIQQGIRTFRAVPGRFEVVSEGYDIAVVVDYAHTEDALARLLAAAQVLKKGRIITVFGCGGDRDRGKRPKMGAVAVQGSDLVFVTSDNPRTEDPSTIIQDIEQGILALPESQRSDYRLITDRRVAIQVAIQEAAPHDMVLIAGKGHEDYQIIGTERFHFDDREVARDALGSRAKTGEWAGK
ncbi:UDP-N-acetylmuramoyl-L-alanyl-D-glutamate--2,6-diaminopimelate ligase [Candidatus Nitronereus thalassa]|uniref:UDP-N-acetylmuramoyl-L-alanyl-D-glutamate--2,6-diaminopimelate ligase n=1 Tax=Candidatus Nitronereus thalassa TaxID=3020898 RepID=A0ABU3KAA0_9BACT|nr:UDP-N-acetylmuramoyl-L-alanyl-D-glutamate--2,6-diaminopimelate ligase [Candidatus Nitronereus thalassa]MDT7043338.1 UDP-N-acetylmuramoyl-L-alanyl-D-glutamate--2,6-diaminopimelate ligase [Candidatus Nitronereus thalassa]